MAIGLGLGIVGGAAILVLLGYLSSGVPSSSLTVSTGAAGPDATCTELCRVWNSRRSTACAALAFSAAANATLAAANAAYASAQATAASLLAAAIATSFIPFFGPALAAPLFAAYAAAQSVALVLLGRQLAASAAASSAAGAVTTALAAVDAARADLVARCNDPAALAQCLGTPSPCSGVP